MNPTPALSVACLLAALGCGGAETRATEDPTTARRAIDAVLDDWHDAAAQADEQRYFGHFTVDAVFLGTDATERWDVAAFHEYAHPHFERGRAWAFRATRRDVIVRGDVAWFDEDLHTENLGPARGSGVLVRNPDGTWRIAQYNLTITVPNERFAEVRDLLASDPPPASDVGTAAEEAPAPDDD